jgi:hypothetical protein
VAGCGVTRLDGIGALSASRELNLQHNAVDDVSALACHDTLQVLDLQDNAIAAMGCIETLGTSSLLYCLDLRGTPLSRASAALKRRDSAISSATACSGRMLVCCHIEQLRMLDGLSTTKEERTAVLSDDVVAHAGACVTRYMVAERSGSLLNCTDSATAAVAAVNSSVLTAGWDSDLTQGGQVFSGSVSSVLRRHKQGLSSGDHIDAQLRQAAHYAGVLETLDQARQMDTTAASAVVSPLLDDRVRQWRSGTAGERHTVGLEELRSDALLQAQQQRFTASPSRQQRVSSGPRTPPTKRTSTPVCLEAINHHNRNGDCSDVAAAAAVGVGGRSITRATTTSSSNALCKLRTAVTALLLRLQQQQQQL